MKRTISKGLSIVLAAVLCLSPLPMTALAVVTVKPDTVYQGDGFYITATKMVERVYSSSVFGDGLIAYSDLSKNYKYGFTDKYGNVVI